MRLLLKLQCSEDSTYDLQYNYHLQSAIYGLLKGGRFDHLHNKFGYKFFCFSNIFPVSCLKKRDIRNLIISSPNNSFINYLYQRLQNLGDLSLKVGKMKFSIINMERFEIDLCCDNKITIVTGTPIIVRIPIKKYLLHGFEIGKDYQYVYWRKDHPIELFIKQLESNLIKKYNQYYNIIGNYEAATARSESGPNNLQDSISFLLFQNFRLKKQVSNRILLKGSTQIVIGTLWEFSFNVSKNDDSIQILQFLLDVGLGERNSLGFGFVNLV